MPIVYTMPALAIYRAPMPVYVYPVATLLSLVHLHIQSLHAYVAYSLSLLETLFIVYTKCL